jgi:hypothetical protein
VAQSPIQNSLPQEFRRLLILHFQRRTIWGRPGSIIGAIKEEKEEKKLGQWNATL